MIQGVRRADPHSAFGECQSQTPEHGAPVSVHFSDGLQVPPGHQSHPRHL